MSARRTQPKHADDLLDDPRVRELSSYFSGALEGAMGLRSWLGRWDTHGPTRPTHDAASPPEPGMQALVAARAMERVEGSLVIAGRRHALVLLGRLGPIGPYARLSTYGDLTGVVLSPAVSAELRALFELDDEEAFRAALRSGSAERARAAMEFIAPASVHDRVVALESAPMTTLRDANTRRARRLRARVKAIAGRAWDDALFRYLGAREEWTRSAREGRIARFTGSMFGRSELK